MRKGKKWCAHECGHLVGGGGDRHRKLGCPPPRGERGEHRRAKRLRKERARRDDRKLRGFDQRGAPIAGTGKVSASSKKKAGPTKAKGPAGGGV